MSESKAEERKPHTLVVSIPSRKLDLLRRGPRDRVHRQKAFPGIEELCAGDSVAYYGVEGEHELLTGDELSYEIRSIEPPGRRPDWIFRLRRRA